MKNIRYQTDENGKRVAVVVPIEEWERLIDTKNGQKKNGNSKKKSPREFYGSMNLDDKDLQDFINHSKKIREEWD